jgi:hypothetical protein
LSLTTTIAYLYDGLNDGSDDVLPIVYREYESSDEADEDEEDGSEEVEVEDLMDIDSTDAVMGSLARPTNHDPPPIISITRSPPLPPSPISNPTSPTPRKRQRLNSWDAPDYIPDFLPPFPVTIPDTTPAETPLEPGVETPTPTAQAERELSPTPPPSAPTGRASYLSSVPYESSSISGKSTAHLPKAPSKNRHKPPISTAISSEAHLALLTAAHHVLTNPPPPPTTQNPSRHSLALALLQSARTRFQPSDSAFGISEPNRTRFGTPTPSFPVALKPEDQKAGIPLPQTSKSFIPGDPIVPLVSLQPSRLPTLARTVLSVSQRCQNSKCCPKPVQAPIYRKITRHLPPPALQRDNRKLTYGPGVPAPWNSKPSDEKSHKNKEKDKDKANVDGGVKLVDALMFATWDWDAKDFRTPLGPRRAIQKMPTFGKMKHEKNKDRSKDKERAKEKGREVDLEKEAEQDRVEEISVDGQLTHV